MRSGQLESGTCVVEGAVGPKDRIVTSLTSGRETRGNMVYRRRCIVVVGLMARDAGGVRDVVVIVDVAICALPRRHSVRSSEGESRAVVIERGVQPGRCVVALIAPLGEIRRHVIRVGRSLVVLQVAGHASRAGQVVVVINVTVAALPRGNRVHTGEGKVGEVVVERGVGPGSRIVTLLAGLGEARGDVVGILRSLVVLEVAGYAGRARQVEVVINVTIGAHPRRHSVSARQRKSDRGVVEIRA